MKADDFLKAQELYEEEQIRNDNLSVLNQMLDFFNDEHHIYYKIKIPNVKSCGKDIYLSFTKQEICNLIDLQKSRQKEIGTEFKNL